jgi:hypothetical protein
MPKPTRDAATFAGDFWWRVEKTDTCWLWRGYLMVNGYGSFSAGPGGSQLVHRTAYELLVGPIPDGMTIDHVKANGCTSRACVKAVPDKYGPTHLEPVTNQENLRRGDGPTGRKARQTHCMRGHIFDERNTLIRRNGTRRCRTCSRADSRRRKASRRSRSRSGVMGDR